MSGEQHQIGMLGRLRLGIGALFGDETAKQSRQALGRLDDYQRYHVFTFGEAARTHDDEAAATLREDLGALQEWGGAERGPAATALTQEWSAAERDGQARLDRGFSAVSARQPAEALAEADALDALRRTMGDLRRRASAVVEAHRTAQREAWDTLLTSSAAARAGRLIQVVDTLPEIPEVPKPDVHAFADPYEQVIALVPEAYRDDDSDAICFDADAVRTLAGTAVSEAAGAEAALTRYLYDAAQGYEAALGKERAAQILQLLRDPAAVRDLRARRPELFEGTAAGSSGFMDLLPLLLVTAILAEHAPAWQPHPADGGGGAHPAATGTTGAVGAVGAAGTTSPMGAPPASQAWLSSLQVPSASELQDIVLQSDVGSSAASDGADDAGFVGSDASDDASDDSGGDGGGNL